MIYLRIVFGGKTGIKNRVKIVIYFGVNFEIVKAA